MISERYQVQLARIRGVAHRSYPDHIVLDLTGPSDLEMLRLCLIGVMDGSMRGEWAVPVSLSTLEGLPDEVLVGLFKTVRLQNDAFVLLNDEQPTI